MTDESCHDNAGDFITDFAFHKRQQILSFSKKCVEDFVNIFLTFQF